MNSVLLILLHGVLLMFVHQLTIASQQVDEGNYIVPRTTLELSTNTNKSAEGHKKICTSNRDCEQYANNHCCPTASGYSKCRKKCPNRNRRRHWGKRRRKNSNKQRKRKEGRSKPTGCVHRNSILQEGAKVKNGCNECICDKGKMICTKRKCPGKCLFKEKLFDEGYRLMLHNGCKKCICRHTVWDCTSHPCDHDANELLDASTDKQRNSVMPTLPSIILVVLCLAVHNTPHVA